MVERAAQPRVSSVRRRLLQLARTATTPLLPDDYIGLLDPRWSTREATGTIEEIRLETEDAATIVIRPSFPWAGHRPGQYLRLGAEVNGVRHWRAYSLTSDPSHPQGLVSVTIKRVEGGRMSPYFVGQAEPGSLVFLGEVEGTFGLPDPLPPRLLLISAGSGVTPLMSIVRELVRRDALEDVVHLHCTRTSDAFIFGDMLRGIARRAPGYVLQEQTSSVDGRLSPELLDERCPDWRDREAFLSGPRDMIDALEARWTADGDPSRLHTERFQPIIGTGDADVGSGGSVYFRVTEVRATCDVGVSMLVGGEAAGALLPYGCRMGICHTCVGKLRVGAVRDLRTGELFDEQGQTVRTCVNAPEGHVEIEL